MEGVVRRNQGKNQQHFEGETSLNYSSVTVQRRSGWHTALVVLVIVKLNQPARLAMDPLVVCRPQQPGTCSFDHYAITT
jgi:hypothetical protein